MTPTRSAWLLGALAPLLLAPRGPGCDVCDVAVEVDALGFTDVAFDPAWGPRPTLDIEVDGAVEVCVGSDCLWLDGPTSLVFADDTEGMTVWNPDPEANVRLFAVAR
jgi:hypothetical protein